MHRIWFVLDDVELWYAIMTEARKMFGRNWRCKKHLRRKLMFHESVKVWFDTPDPHFGTWIAVKYAVVLKTPPNK